MFVQPADGLLQLLLLRLGQDVGELVAGLQEHAEDALVQLAEEVLQAFTEGQGEHGFICGMAGKCRNSVIECQDEPW